MRIGLPKNFKKACERPRHAQWARPAGQRFLDRQANCSRKRMSPE